MSFPSGEMSSVERLKARSPSCGRSTENRMTGRETSALPHELQITTARETARTPAKEGQKNLRYRSTRGAGTDDWPDGSFSKCRAAMVRVTRERLDSRLNLLRFRASSAADWYLSAGSFARQSKIIASISGSRSGFTVAMGGGSTFTIS